MTLLAFLIAALTVTGPPRWSQDAHRIICEIAWLELNPDVRLEIGRLLSSEDQPRTFAQGCTWADQATRTREYAEYRPAHYVNVPANAAGVDIARDCAETICVLEAIDQFSRVVGDAGQSPGVRLVALKFLAHFVGDLHQPLHVAYAEDRGGNERRISFDGRVLDLHELWDRVLVGTQPDWREGARAAHANIDPIDRTVWRSGTPTDWANESFQIVENEVYADLEGSNVSEAYAMRHRRTAERRISQAGVRLGDLLNRLMAG